MTTISGLFPRCIWMPSIFCRLFDRQSAIDEIKIGFDEIIIIIYHWQLFDGQHIQYEMRIFEIVIDNCLIDWRAVIDAIQTNVVESPKQRIERWCHVQIAIRTRPVVDEPWSGLFAETHQFIETWQMLGVHISRRLFGARISQCHNLHILTIFVDQFPYELKWMRNGYIHFWWKRNPLTINEEHFCVAYFLLNAFLVFAFFRFRSQACRTHYIKCLQLINASAGANKTWRNNLVRLALKMYCQFLTANDVERSAVIQQKLSFWHFSVESSFYNLFGREIADR